MSTGTEFRPIDAISEDSVRRAYERAIQPGGQSLPDVLRNVMALSNPVVREPGVPPRNPPAPEPPSTTFTRPSFREQFAEALFGLIHPPGDDFGGGQFADALNRILGIQSGIPDVGRRDIPAFDVGRTPTLQRDPALLDRLRGVLTQSLFGALRPRGTSLFDPTGGSTLNPGQRSILQRYNARDLASLSDTQGQALDALLSANRIAPEDFRLARRRELLGFNPVSSNASARFAGAL